MNAIKKIHDIVDANFDQEMDSWYYGPCDEIRSIAEDLTEKEWNELIESTKPQKPDMWRVMLSHSFIDSELSIGLSEQLVTFQASKCENTNDAYLIVQYMDDFDWNKIPSWLLQIFSKKLEIMSAECGSDIRIYIDKLKNVVDSNYT